VVKIELPATIRQAAALLDACAMKTSPRRLTSECLEARQMFSEDDWDPTKILGTLHSMDFGATRALISIGKHWQVSQIRSIYTLAYPWEFLDTRHAMLGYATI
jgi:hypothetical protein